MFGYCSSLLTAPVLPATTLAQSCYKNMFYYCSSLLTPPQLPATTLAKSCYEGMFNGCSSLNVLPELPATTLAESCYEGMFAWCKWIELYTSAPSIYMWYYKIPKSWTGTTATRALIDMFYWTGGTLNWTPSINVSYYIKFKPI